MRIIANSRDGYINIGNLEAVSIQTADGKTVRFKQHGSQLVTFVYDQFGSQLTPQTTETKDELGKICLLLRGGS